MENKIQLQDVLEKSRIVSSENDFPQGRKIKGTLDVTDIIGEDGKWQRKIFYMTLVCSITTAWNHLGISFLAYPIEYWCARPQGINISLETWKSHFLPNVTIRGESSTNQCEILIRNFTIKHEVYFLNETVKCDTWEYSSEYYSIVEQWDLVCRKAWMLSMSQSVYMLAYLIAVSITGQLADLFGRRPAILANVIILVLASTATAFSTSFTMFVILRCFVALGQAGMELTAYVLVTETFGPSCRATYIMLQLFSFTLGYLLLPVIAWLLSNWFYLQLTFALFSLCYVHYFWFLPESLRWLFSKGHTERVVALMKSAVEENGIVIQDIEEKIEKIYSFERNKKESETTVTIIDLFKTPNLCKKTLYLFFIWITLTFTYYGISFYSTELDGNKFLNFFFSGLAEIPATLYCVLTANRYGRKKTLFLSLMIGGLLCLTFIIIPTGYEVMKIILATSGKIFISGAFSIIYLFSAEIFPTVARNAGIGLCSMVGRIGSALSPFMRDLGQSTYPAVPLVLFGVLCLISSFFLLKFPETNLKPIPETLNEAELVCQATVTDKRI